MSALAAFRERYLLRFWAPLPTLIALGVASAYYFALTGTFWAVTGEFTRWGGQVLAWFGVPVRDWSYFRLIGLQGTPLDRIDGVMIIGMLLGALACALGAGNVGLRWPTSRRRLLQGLVGGIIAGFGARLAMLPWLRIPLKVTARAAVLPDAGQLARRARRQARLGLAVLVVALLFAAWRFEVSLVLGLATLFGLVFGGLIERAQICFTSAARDLWTTGRTQAATGILLGMAVACLGTFGAIQLGMAPKIFWMGPNAVIGGLLFGVGIVLAGGCETGWMYRAVEGQLHFWVVGLGNVIGGTLVAVYWDRLGSALALPYPRINLLQQVGPGSGLLLTFAGLALCLLLVQLNARRFTRPRKPVHDARQDADAVA